MKTKRDILFLCQYFYPEYVSSATLPFDTAKALVQAGFSVSALCGYPSEYNKTSKCPLAEEHEGIMIRRLKYLQLERSNFLGRMINYFSFTFMVFLRFFHLRCYKAVIVYSNPPVLPLIAAWAKRLFGTKMVFVCYDVYPEMAHITGSISENGLISKLMRFINRSIYKNVDRVIALSNEMKDYLLEHREQLTPDKVVVIPNWYEDNPLSYKEGSVKNKLFSPIKNKGELIVSYFGNMGIAQDLDTVIDAIKNVKEDSSIQFFFAGHGNKMESLKNILENEKLENVNIYDFLHGQDFQDALNISDCFLVSLSEGLTGLAVPSKTYSYMMVGRPIIAIIGENSDIAKDLLNNDAGFVIQVGESDKLVNTIKYLRDNKAKRKIMGENCRNIFVEKYKKEKCTKQYVDIMRSLLGA